MQDCLFLPPPSMCEAYFSDTERGFSSSTARVFTKLKDSNYQDLLTPARQQFMGQGSCGNGGAMRVSPAALYGYRDEATLIQVSGLWGPLNQTM